MHCYFQMENRISENSHNKQYQDPGYWDQRFAEEDSYEWLAAYDDIKDIVREALDKVGPKAKILQLGCGNSQLAFDLYNEGFEDITNIDISEVVIKKMSSKHPHLKFIQMDATKIDFGSEMFDFVIEKSTLDALLVDTESPWDLTSNGSKTVFGVLNSVKNLLTAGGSFMSITFAQPHFRVPLLAQEGLGWSIKVDKFTSMGLDYFTFLCEEGSAGPAVAEWCVGAGPIIEENEAWSSSDDEEFLTKIGDGSFDSDCEEDVDGVGGNKS